MKKLLILAVLVIAIASQANDGVYYTSGNQLMPLVETDISVKKEVLTISLQDNGLAKVDVYYEFFNPGSKAKTVQMGFEALPSYNDDYEFYPDGKHPHIKDFTVEMNGQPVTYRNAVSDVSKFAPINTSQWKFDEESGTSIVNKVTGKTLEAYAYVYYFDATFQPGVTRVHHTYSYTMSMTIGTTFEVPYKLSPAGRWAGGSIGDFTLIVRADNTAKHFYMSQQTVKGAKPKVIEGKGKFRTSNMYDNATWEIALRNGAVSFHAVNFRPSSEHELYIYSADVSLSFNEDARFGEFYDRSTPTGLFFWTEYDYDRTQKLSPQLFERIAHNLPYAHRGRVFKTPEIQKYMESLWWYMPDPQYKDDTSGFTKADWEYVRYKK